MKAVNDAFPILFSFFEGSYLLCMQQVSMNESTDSCDPLILLFQRNV